MYSPPRNPLDTGRFQKIARTFSGDHHIVVDASTFDCSYNPGTRVIRIPANSESLPEELQDIVEGQLDHEMLHARAEQRARDRRARGEEVTLPSEAMGRLPDAKRRQLFNVVKDVADECDGAREYVGISRHLDINNEYCLEKLRRQMQAGNLSPWRQVTCGAILSARGLPVDWLPPDVQKLVAELNPELSQAQFATEAEQQVELVEKIWTKIQHLADQDKQDEREEKPGDGGSGGGGGDDDGGGGGDEGDEGEEDSSGRGVSSGSAAKAAAEAMKSRETCDDVTDLARKSISDDAVSYAKTERRTHVPCPAALAADKVVVAPSWSMDSYLDLLESIRPVVGALRSKMMMLLRARAACRIEPDQEEGSLDHSQLYRLFGDRLDPNIFYSEEEGQTLSVAVSILRDFSGSMCGKAHLEQLACLAITEALSQLGVVTEVIGFSNPGDEVYGDHKLYNRFEPFRFTVFKTFDEDYRRVKTRFGGESVKHIRGNNSDAEAVMFSARRLAVRREARRILLVLSDGRPWAVGDNDLLYEATKENVVKISKAGIECVGIGIRSTSVEGIYPEHIVVEEMSKLAPQLFRCMKKLLLRKPRGMRCRA